MLDILKKLDYVEVHIGYDGRVWVNTIDGCVLRIGVPESPSSVVLVDDRQSNDSFKKLSEMVVCYLAGGCTEVELEGCLSMNQREEIKQIKAASVES